MSQKCHMQTFAENGFDAVGRKKRQGNEAAFASQGACFITANPQSVSITVP
jgi:hypothetical protein